MKNTLVVFTFIIVLSLMAIVLAYPTMLLWNGCLVPAVDGVNKISFLQALGINFLFSILFKSYNTNNNK